jgi:hypothetical protein
VRLRGLLQSDELATTDVVLMEVLAGARDDPHRDRPRGLLARCVFIATEDLATTRTLRSFTESAWPAAIPCVP